jgi:hypothetical protein
MKNDDAMLLIGIDPAIRCWALALIYFALSAYPGLKSGAIIQDLMVGTIIAPAFKPGIQN